MSYEEFPPADPSVESLMLESRRALEAMVLVASDPVPTQLLAQLLELSVDSVDRLCRDVAASYDEAGHGFQLVEVAGGWRYQTHPDLHPYVERYAMDGQSTRLSRAALETLAIVAYKQPISRAQVSAIRGVSVDAVLRTLEQRGYVEEVGRDTGVGQAVLFGTTPYFLERVGLSGTNDLPSLGEFVPAAEVVEALEQTLRVELDPLPETEAVEVAESVKAGADGEVGDEPESDVESSDRAAEPEAPADHDHDSADPADVVIDLRSTEAEVSRETDEAEAERLGEPSESLATSPLSSAAVFTARVAMPSDGPAASEDQGESGESSAQIDVEVDEWARESNRRNVESPAVGTAEGDHETSEAEMESIAAEVPGPEVPARGFPGTEVANSAFSAPEAPGQTVPEAPIPLAAVTEVIDLDALGERDVDIDLVVEGAETPMANLDDS